MKMSDFVQWLILAAIGIVVFAGLTVFIFWGSLKIARRLQDPVEQAKEVSQRGATPEHNHKITFPRNMVLATKRGGAVLFHMAGDKEPFLRVDIDAPTTRTAGGK